MPKVVGALGPGNRTGRLQAHLWLYKPKGGKVVLMRKWGAPPRGPMDGEVVPAEKLTKDPNCCRYEYDLGLVEGEPGFRKDRPRMTVPGEVVQHLPEGESRKLATVEAGMLTTDPAAEERIRVARENETSRQARNAKAFFVEQRAEEERFPWPHGKWVQDEPLGKVPPRGRV